MGASSRRSLSASEQFCEDIRDGVPPFADRVSNVASIPRRKVPQGLNSVADGVPSDLERCN